MLRLHTQPQKLLQPPRGWGQHPTHHEILPRMKRLGLFFPLHEISTNYPKAHQQFSAVAEFLALLVFVDLCFVQAVCHAQVRAQVSAFVLAQELAPAADETAA